MSENHDTELPETPDTIEGDWTPSAVSWLVWRAARAVDEHAFLSAISESGEIAGTGEMQAGRMLWGVAIAYRDFDEDHIREHSVHLPMTDTAPSTYGERQMVEWWLKTKSEHKSRWMGAHSLQPANWFAMLFKRPPDWCQRLIDFIAGGVVRKGLGLLGKT